MSVDSRTRIEKGLSVGPRKQGLGNKLHLIGSAFRKRPFPTWPGKAPKLQQNPVSEKKIKGGGKERKSPFFHSCLTANLLGERVGTDICRRERFSNPSHARQEDNMFTT